MNLTRPRKWRQVESKAEATPKSETVKTHVKVGNEYRQHNRTIRATFNSTFQIVKALEQIREQWYLTEDDEPVYCITLFPRKKRATIDTDWRKSSVTIKDIVGLSKAKEETTSNISLEPPIKRRERAEIKNVEPKREKGKKVVPKLKADESYDIDRRELTTTTAVIETVELPELSDMCIVMNHNPIVTLGGLFHQVENIIGYENNSLKEELRHLVDNQVELMQYKEKLESAITIARALSEEVESLSLKLGHKGDLKERNIRVNNKNWTWGTTLKSMNAYLDLCERFSHRVNSVMDVSWREVSKNEEIRIEEED